jgi:hypothetical protein
LRVITTCRIAPPLREGRTVCEHVRVRITRLLSALGPALLIACATARTPSTGRDVPLAAQVEAPGLLFQVLYTPPDAGEVARIERGLLAVGTRLSRWGSFRQGVYIRVFPDHQALEAAVDRRDYPWLRAWAFGDQVLLQSPRSWNDEPASLQPDLDELLLHELTHALMYQLIEPAEGAASAAPEEPPLWFREGMASVTADQGHRRLSPADLGRWLATHPGADVLHPTAELYRSEKEAVYGAAHRAFDLLLRLSGDQGVRDLLRAVSMGARFADAFRTTTGHALADFETEAVRSGFDLAASKFKGSGAGGP